MDQHKQTTHRDSEPSIVVGLSLEVEVSQVARSVNVVRSAGREGVISVLVVLVSRNRLSRGGEFGLGKVPALGEQVRMNRGNTCQVSSVIPMHRIYSPITLSRPLSLRTIKVRWAQGQANDT